jgi:hypothetical protein
MRAATSESFGLLIAYLIPGFITLWGLSRFWPEIESWLGTSAAECETIGGFLYGTVAAIAAGLTVSTIRWLVIDPIHHWTGIKQPEWNFQTFHARTTGFEVLIEIHYRYYQFYANCLVAFLFAFMAHWLSAGFDWRELLVVVALTALFFAGSRDTLSKYYGRVATMLQHSDV